MGGCKKYWRAELLNISQDHLWQDMEIKECSCHCCWEICWKYAVCSVHRARPWACPHDLALVITRMSPLTEISSSLSPGAFQLDSASTALVSISLPSLSLPVSPYPGSHWITLPVSIQALQEEKNPAAVPGRGTGHRRRREQAR